MEIPKRYRGNGIVAIFLGRDSAGYYPRFFKDISKDSEDYIKDVNGRESIGDKVVKAFKKVNFDFYARTIAYTTRLNKEKVQVREINLEDITK